MSDNLTAASELLAEEMRQLTATIGYLTERRLRIERALGVVVEHPMTHEECLAVPPHDGLSAKQRAGREAAAVRRQCPKCEQTFSALGLGPHLRWCGKPVETPVTAGAWTVEDARTVLDGAA